MSNPRQITRSQVFEALNRAVENDEDFYLMTVEEMAADMIDCNALDIGLTHEDIPTLIPFIGEWLETKRGNEAEEEDWP